MTSRSAFRCHLELEQLEEREAPAVLDAAPPPISPDALVAAALVRMNSRARLAAEAAAGPRPLAFLGDSITEGFLNAGADSWGGVLAPAGAANLGAGGATAPEVLGLLRSGVLAHVRPRVVVLEIGTNDLLSGSSPQEAALNVLAILRELRRQAPETRVVVAGVLPLGDFGADPLRRASEQFNRLLSRWVPSMNATFVEPGQYFLRPDGRLAPELFVDGIHPTAAGYRVYTLAIAPAITAALSEGPAAPDPDPLSVLQAAFRAGQQPPFLSFKPGV